MSRMDSNEPDLEPFDYVRDSQGNVYVVRLDFRRNSCVALKPIYDLGRGKLMKRNSTTASPDALDIEGRLDDLLDFDCVIMPRCGLAPLAKWNSEPIVSADQVPAIIRPAVRELLYRGVQLFLYGSRLLGHEQRESDWDFLVAAAGNMRELLNELIVAGALGPLGSSEIDVLLERYHYPEVCISRSTVSQIVTACITFAVVGDIQVDFFPVGIPEQAPAPAQLSDFPGMVEGTILKEQGQSFVMPRRFLIETSRKIEEIWHFCWLLGGLEQLAGSKIKISDMLIDDRGRIWFSPRRSTMEMVLDAKALQHS